MFDAIQQTKFFLTLNKVNIHLTRRSKLATQDNNDVILWRLYFFPSKFPIIKPVNFQTQFGLFWKYYRVEGWREGGLVWSWLVNELRLDLPSEFNSLMWSTLLILVDWMKWNLIVSKLISSVKKMLTKITLVQKAVAISKCTES